MNRFFGKFKGVYHVYDYDGQRHIEEYFYECFEETMPTCNDRTLSDEYKDSHYSNQLLELDEIEKIESEDFFFEILGVMEINFYNYSWEYPNEVDSEMVIDKYTINILDEKTAQRFSNKRKYNEKY